MQVHFNEQQSQILHAIMDAGLFHSESEMVDKMVELLATEQKNRYLRSLIEQAEQGGYTQWDDLDEMLEVVCYGKK